MIYHPIANGDFFAQLSHLSQNQIYCADTLMLYFENELTEEQEHECLISAQKYARHIEMQNILGLFPADRKKYCILMGHLCYSGQIRLLRILHLLRLYHAESFKMILRPTLFPIRTLCISIKEFTTPSKASDRFSIQPAENSASLCFDGLSALRSIPFNDHPALSAVEQLFLKDICEEFVRFYSSTLQYIHCGLRFPL